MTCASSGSADAVRMLIARGADVNAKEPSQNQTALMWAAAERHPDVVQRAHRGAAPISRPTRERDSPRCTSRRGRATWRARALLLAAGVNVNIRSQPEPVGAGAGQERPPDRADGVGSRGGGRRPRGPAYQATLSAGSTPLLVATVRGQVPLALFLLEHGADPNVGDAGFTPLHWAAGTWEGGASNPGLRFQRSDERDSGSPGQAAAGEGAAGSRRESERAHDAAAAGIRRRIRGRGRRDAVPARQRRRRSSR